MGVIARHITIRVDQFYCCQCAIRWDSKTAALVFRTKANWRLINFDPGV